MRNQRPKHIGKGLLLMGGILSFFGFSFERDLSWLNTVITKMLPRQLLDDIIIPWLSPLDTIIGLLLLGATLLWIGSWLVWQYKWMWQIVISFVGSLITAGVLALILPTAGNLLLNILLSTENEPKVIASFITSDNQIFTVQGRISSQETMAELSITPRVSPTLSESEITQLRQELKKNTYALQLTIITMNDENSPVEKKSYAEAIEENDLRAFQYREYYPCFQQQNQQVEGKIQFAKPFSSPIQFDLVLWEPANDLP